MLLNPGLKNISSQAAMSSLADWDVSDLLAKLDLTIFPLSPAVAPESVKIPEFKWVNTITGNVKTALHGVFHALSKKHFSRYLAEFCYRFNHRIDLKQMVPRFGYVAVRTPPMPQRLLKLAESHG